MAENKDNAGSRRKSRWRLVAWSFVALLLLLPLMAMQFTDEVDWDVADFTVAAALLIGTGITFELTAKKTGNRAYQAAVGVALAGAFLLIWMNSAVGIIGNENNPLNLMYHGVLTVGIVGALIVRFQSRGMARVLVATALAQTLVAVIALIAGQFTLILNGFFVGLWLISAELFRKAEHVEIAGGTEFH